MRPSEVRRHVLSDHADIQMMLERLDRVAQRVRRGEHPLLGPLRDGGEALLKTLGSLRRIRESTQEELKGVPGISDGDSQAICAFFAAFRSGPSESPAELPEE